MTLLGIPLPPDTPYITLKIHYYALCILVGIAVGYYLTKRRYVARGGDGEVVLTVAVWTVAMGIVGARVGAVVTYPEMYFNDHTSWWHIFAIWEGGMAIYGSIVFGIVTIFLVLRHYKLKALPFLDAAAPGVLIAQGIGRLGNWFNQELYGTPTTLPWGQQIDAAHLPPGVAEGTLFHPTFLYEMLWNFLVAAILLIWEKTSKRGLRAGEVTGGYLLGYGLGRAAIEMIRTDYSLYFLGIRLFVLVSLAGALLGLCLILWSRKTQGPSVVEAGRKKVLE